MATSQLARSSYTIISSGDPSAHTSTPQSASGTVAAGSKLEMQIQDVCKSFRRTLLPEDDDDAIKKELGTTWFRVYNTLSKTGNSKLKDRLRNESEFKAYVRPGSNGERQLLTLLRSMAKQQVPWRNLFEHGTSLSSLWSRSH